MTQLPCVIFAGGKSSRLGTDKALLPFGNASTLVEFQYKRLQPIFSHLYVSCKDASLFHFHANFIEDTFDEIFAPTLGFLSAFDTLQCEAFFAISVDTPFIGDHEIEKLLSYKGAPYDAIIAKTAQKIHPMCGIYNQTLYPRFYQMLQTNEHKLQRLLLRSNTKYIDFQDEQSFFNINTEEEYQLAKQYSMQIN